MEAKKDSPRQRVAASKIPRKRELSPESRPLKRFSFKEYYLISPSKLNQLKRGQQKKSDKSEISQDEPKAFKQTEPKENVESEKPSDSPSLESLFRSLYGVNVGEKGIYMFSALTSSTFTAECSNF